MSNESNNFFSSIVASAIGFACAIFVIEWFRQRSEAKRMKETNDAEQDV